MNPNHQERSYLYRIAPCDTEDEMQDKAARELCRKWGLPDTMVDNIKTAIGIGYQYGLLDAANTAEICAEKRKKTSLWDYNICLDVCVNIVRVAEDYADDWFITIDPNAKE